MAKTHRPHRAHNAWKRDILLLTSILRLRVSPLVPYALIADIILSTLPNLALKLAEEVAPDEVKPQLLQRGMKDWLAVYLEETYDGAEHWVSESWIMARDFETEKVSEILRVVRLDTNEYGVADSEEMRAQIKWKMEGDWKASSEPLGRPLRIPVAERMSNNGLAVLESARTEVNGSATWIDDAEEDIKPRGRATSERYEVGQEGPEEKSRSGQVSSSQGHGVAVEKEKRVKGPKIYLCWRSFSDQLEEIRMAEDAMKRKGCTEGR